MFVPPAARFLVGCAAVALVAASGCGSSPGSNPAALPTATSTTIVPVAVGLLPPGDLTTATAAAREFWDSWRDSDRDRALQHTGSELVAELFSTLWTPAFRFGGCDDQPVSAASGAAGRSSEASEASEASGDPQSESDGAATTDASTTPGAPAGLTADAPSDAATTPATSAPTADRVDCVFLRDGGGIALVVVRLDRGFQVRSVQPFGGAAPTRPELSPAAPRDTVAPVAPGVTRRATTPPAEDSSGTTAANEDGTDSPEPTEVTEPAAPPADAPDPEPEPAPEPVPPAETAPPDGGAVGVRTPAPPPVVDTTPA